MPCWARVLGRHAHWVMGLCFSADGALLASASYDRSVRVWDVSGRRVLHVLSGHADRVTSVALLARSSSSALGPDAARSQLLASGSYDKEVRVWDLETGQLVADAAHGPRCLLPLDS